MIVFKARTTHDGKDKDGYFPTIYDNVTYSEIETLYRLAAKNPGVHLHFWAENVPDPENAEESPEVLSLTDPETGAEVKVYRREVE